MIAPLRTISADLTVVVPTNGSSLLAGCLQSIVDGIVWPAAVVVVDQSGGESVTDCVASSAACGLSIVRIASTDTGISAATNLGLRHVRTPFAAVTHDDCRVQDDWVDRMATTLARAGEAIVTGRVEPAGDGVVLTVKTDSEPAKYTRPLLKGDVLFPPNMGFGIRVLDRVGWFDEHPSLATAGEDNEWAHRALRVGIPILYEPAIVVQHLARHRVGDLPDLYRRYARGHGAFYGKWLRRGDLFILRRATRDVVRAPWLLARGVLSRNPDLVAMGRGEVLGLLPGILAGLRNHGDR